MSNEYKIGDPVEVLDPGLARLRAVMKSVGIDVINHHGWVHSIESDRTIIVEFPIGDDDPDEHSQIAPYPASMVKPRKGRPR